MTARSRCSFSFQNVLHALAMSTWFVCLMNRTASSSYQRLRAPPSSESPLLTLTSPTAEAISATMLRRLNHLYPTRQAPYPAQRTTSTVVNALTTVFVAPERRGGAAAAKGAGAGAGAPASA